MTRVTVFGGAGFLGSYVTEALLRHGYQVVVADTQKPKDLDSNKMTFVTCDINDREQVANAISQSDVVFNFAALANLDEAYQKPVESIQINVMGNLNILEALRGRNIKRFVYASSAYALSDKGSFYGISKHTSEKLVEEYSRRFGLPFTIIRYGSLYGERAGQDNFMFQVLSEALQSGKLVLKGEGDELREYIHAVDAAELSVNTIEDEKYNGEHIILTGMEKLSRLELFQMIKEVLGGGIEICRSEEKYAGHYKITPYVYQPTRGKKLVANPFIDLGQGILDCVAALERKAR